MLLDYQDIYQQCRDDLRMAERIRRRNMPWVILGSLAVLAVPIWLLTRMTLIVIDSSNTDEVGEILIIGVFFFTVAGIGALRYFAFRSVQLIFRGKIVPAIIARIGPDFHYSQSGEVAREIGDASRIFPTHSLWDGDDYVSGKIEGDLFELSKLRLKRTSGSSSSGSSGKSQSTVFLGVIIHMELSTHLTDPIWILPRSSLGTYFPRIKEVEGREIIRMDGLPSRYRLHTTNAVLARRLFSGNMLVTIRSIIKAFKQKGISNKGLRFAFFDNHIVIAFKRKKGVFHLSWMPLFVNLDSPKFIQKQLTVINEALRLRQILKG